MNLVLLMLLNTRKWKTYIKVIQDPRQKITQCFYKSKLSLFIVLKRTSIGVYKNIIYQQICMTKYILTVWSSFTPQYIPSYTWSDNCGQKS